MDLTRRSFLRTTLLGSGWLALVRLRPVAADAVPPPAAGEWHVLSPPQRDILTAIGERMTFTGDPSMPRFGDTAALATIDRALLFAGPDVRNQLGWLLTLFEWGPVFLTLHFARFSELDAAGQDDYIRDWALSRFGIRRVGFQALKNLSMLGYYSQDETWKGIHYRGPWLPRPRRGLPAGKGQLSES